MTTQEFLLIQKSVVVRKKYYSNYKPVNSFDQTDAWVKSVSEIFPSFLTHVTKTQQNLYIVTNITKRTLFVPKNILYTIQSTRVTDAIASFHIYEFLYPFHTYIYRFKLLATSFSKTKWLQAALQHGSATRTETHSLTVSGVLSLFLVQWSKFWIRPYVSHYFVMKIKADPHDRKTYTHVW